MNRKNTEEFKGSVTILYDPIMVDTYHYTFVKLIEGTTLRENPNVNYELWVIMMCQGRFTSVTNVPLW